MMDKRKKSEFERIQKEIERSMARMRKIEKELRK